MSYGTEEASRRRVMQGAVVRITFSAPEYWFAGQSELNLADLPSNSAGDNGRTSIVCMGTMFTSNQTTPAEPQHVIGALPPIDNPIMAWDGNAALRTLVSHDRRLATLIHHFDATPGNFIGTNPTWEEWAVNYKGCTVTVADKLTNVVLYTLQNVKVTAENVATQGRAVMARDVQFNHLGQF